MKIKYFFSLLCIIMLLSCASAKKEVKNRQSDASRNLGEAYMTNGNYTAALKEFLEGEKGDPNDFYIQNDLGLTYMAKKRVDLAIQHYQKAIALKPDFAAARNNLATAYLAQERWDDAIAVLNEVLQDMLYTTPHFAYVNLGWAYYNKKQYGLAEKYYREALATQPRYVVALLGLGKTCLAGGKPAEAVSVLEKALKITPRFIPLYLEIARGYQAVGNHQAALDAYRKVMALAPDTPFSDEARREAGNLYLNTGGNQ